MTDAYVASPPLPCRARFTCFPLAEATTDNLQPVLRSLFGELTLLGFIGLSLFVIGKMDAVKGLSVQLFGEKTAVAELCESVHMALFLVMLLFLATVLLLIESGKSIANRWHAWERA